MHSDQVTGWTAEELWFVSWQGQDIYLLQVVQTGSGVYQALHSKYPGILSQGKVAGA